MQRDAKGRFVEGRYKDYSGIKKNRLTFISFDHIHYTPKGKKVPYWLCKCDCGNEIVVSSKDAFGGHTKSCGCFQKEQASKAQKKHGESDTRLHLIWQNMRRRCYSQNNEKYNTYGQRGIEVCAEWKDNYIKFADWARSNGYKEDLTLERIDIDKGYEPSNCKWIGMSEQSRNKTVTHYHTIDGKTYQTMNDLADAFNLPVKTLYARYYRGDRGNGLVRPLGKRRWKTTPR